MAQSVVELKCPGCGAPVSTDQQECQWCHSPINIATFNSVANMTMPELGKYSRSYQQALTTHPDDATLNKSIALVYLKLKMYDKAAAAFAKAVEDNFDDSESYFYAACCLLNGKKAFLNNRQTIDQCTEYINAALMIEPKGIYHYFLAYIGYDYFARKHLRTSPTYLESLQAARSAGLSNHDIGQLYAILGVARPSSL